VAGELSMDQAREVTGAELAQPGCEGELLELARRASLAKLKDEARRRRHEVIGADELHRRQRKARSFRHWRTPLGTIGLAGELPPEVGVPIVNRLDAECDRIRSAAKKENAKTGGPLEPRRAYAADAFVKFVSGNGKGTASRADVVVVVDLRAFRRGHAERDEPCHIIGGGPIPVGVAKELARDAFIKAVVHDGVAIHTVKHFGRHINVALRTALELGDPPRFEGVECVEPDCDRRYHLEWDHVDPFANDGPTCFTNLQPRCWSDHRAKTERDRRAGLLNKRRKRSKEVRL